MSSNLTFTWDSLNLLAVIEFQLDKLSGKEGEGTGDRGGFLGSGLNWKSHWAIMISSKAFSVYGEDTDNKIIKVSDLPHWMDIDTLYLFRYENEKDDSEFVQKIAANDLTVVEPIQGKDLKGDYQLLIETKSSFTFLGMKYCKEMNKWVAAMRKAKQTVEEISRTKFNALTKNIDPIIALYKQKVTSRLT